MRNCHRPEQTGRWDNSTRRSELEQKEGVNAQTRAVQMEARAGCRGPQSASVKRKTWGGGGGMGSRGR